MSLRAAISRGIEGPEPGVSPTSWFSAPQLCGNWRFRPESLIEEGENSELYAFICVKVPGSEPF